MMTRSRILLFIALAGIVAIAAGAALAQPCGGMRAADPQGEVVCWPGNRHPPAQLRQLSGNPGSCRGVAIEDANGAALFQKATRGGLADATGSTGHQHVFALQAAHRSPPV